MVSETSGPPQSTGEARERMQRVRVGVTGLAGVVVVVALVSAVAANVQQRATDTAMSNRPEGVSTVKTAPETTEPLAQLGVAPDAANEPDRPAK